MQFGKETDWAISVACCRALTLLSKLELVMVQGTGLALNVLIML